MSDQDERPHDPLEQELRAWFRSDGTSVAPSALRTFATRLGAQEAPTDAVRAASVRPRAAMNARLVAVTAAAAVILVASTFVLVAGRPGPTAGSGSSVAPPLGSPTPSPTTTRSTASLTPPTAVDDAGTFGTGGIWAVIGDRLYVLTDGIVNWISRVPAPHFGLDIRSGNVLSSVFVLDTEHAWVASPGSGSTVPYSGGGPSVDHLHVVVNRTTDSGASWAPAAIPGDWGGTQPVIAFADAQHGFVLLSSLRGGPPSTVFATDDGGATWRHVGGKDGLGSVFTVSDPNTLWAGNQGDAGPVQRDILDVSRDGGRTWADARLPGLVGDHFVNDVAAPPVFVGADGAVAVVAGATDSPADIRFYRTTDGGRSWALATRVGLNASESNAVAVVDPTHYVVTDPQAGIVSATADAGGTWTRSPMTALAGSVRRFWDAQNGLAIVGLGNDAAPAAGLYRTADGGRTWTPVTLPPSGG
ncbi:MAG TPA: hypothetical protein VHS36_06505 [Candidatus Limnocylindrales bacterium]|nr:hypothetical protein [Candidatus Limnocylindrales bacterium]